MGADNRFGAASLAPRQEIAWQAMVLALDPVFRTASLGQRVAELTRREFAVLDLLEQAAGALVTHETLLGEVWGPNTARANLRVAIAGLRRKLEPDPDLPSVILAVPKLGYRLEIAGAPGPTRTGTSCDTRF